MYERYFFQCKNCGYMLTSLTQINKEVNVCPHCEGGDIDYAPKQAREDYIRALTEELKFMHQVQSIE